MLWLMAWVSVVSHHIRIGSTLSTEVIIESEDLHQRQTHHKGGDYFEDDGYVLCWRNFGHFLALAFVQDQVQGNLLDVF